MQAFPLFLSLQGRRALVVGGGDAAARKAELLLKAGAQVSLIAETVGGEVAQFIAEGHVSWAGRVFDDTDLEGLCDYANLPVLTIVRDRDLTPGGTFWSCSD